MSVGAPVGIRNGEQGAISYGAQEKEKEYTE